MRWQDYFDCKFPESSCLNGSESDLFKQGAWLAVKHINGTPGGGYPGARLDDTDSGILIEEKRRGYASAIQKALNHVKAAQAWRDQLPAGRTVADLKAAGFKDKILPGRVDVLLTAEVQIDRVQMLSEARAQWGAHGIASATVNLGPLFSRQPEIQYLLLNSHDEQDSTALEGPISAVFTLSIPQGCTLLTQTMEALQEGDAEARREHPRP